MSISSVSRSLVLKAARLSTPDRALAAILAKHARLDGWLASWMAAHPADTFGDGGVHALLIAAEDAVLAEETEVDALIVRAEAYLACVFSS